MKSCLRLLFLALLVVLTGTLSSCNRVANAPLLVTENPEPQTTETLRKGKVLYNFHCSGCHGEQGQGMGPDAVDRGLPAPALYPYVKDGSTNDVAYRIACGKQGMMPHFRSLLTDSELWQLSSYVSTLASH